MTDVGKEMYFALFNGDVEKFKQLFQENPNFTAPVYLWGAGFGDLALFMMDNMSFDLLHFIEQYDTNFTEKYQAALSYSVYEWDCCCHLMENHDSERDESEKTMQQMACYLLEKYVYPQGLINRTDMTLKTKDVKREQVTYLHLAILNNLELVQEWLLDHGASYAIPMTETPEPTATTVVSLVATHKTALDLCPDLLIKFSKLGIAMRANTKYCDTQFVFE